MEFLLTLGAAATPTMLLVAMFKLARPAAQSWAVVLCCFVSGEVMAFLLTVAQGAPLSAQQLAQTAIAGVFGAATAAGVRSADNNADTKRQEVKQ